MTIKIFSWELIKENTLVKNLDYSSFHERATAIPQDFYQFFNTSIQNERELPVMLLSGHFKFKATIKTKLKQHKRKYINWESDFSNYLKEEFLNWEDIEAGEKTSNMKLAFIKENDSNAYQILVSSTNKNISENSGVVKIEQRNDIGETEKLRLIKSRVGQGVYRKNLIKVEDKCRVTGLSDSNYLIASHIKPWGHSNDNEKLDGNNGLLLSPHIDKLFDNGHISFSNDGNMLISTRLNTDVLTIWNVNKVLNIGSFNRKQEVYLEYHRTNIFEK
jgi:predicted restriction endonuclease